MEYFSLLNSLLCNGCEISPQNTKASAHFTFTLSRKCHLFFCTNKGCWCLLLEIHLYIFRKPFTLKLCSSVFSSLFFFFCCCQWAAVTPTIRGSPQSQAGPRGAHSACFVLALNLSVGVGDYSKCFLLFLLLIACIALKKKKQAMKARWLRRQHCEVNIFHGAERMVEK